MLQGSFRTIPGRYFWLSSFRNYPAAGSVSGLSDHPQSRGANRRFRAANGAEQTQQHGPVLPADRRALALEQHALAAFEPRGVVHGHDATPVGTHEKQLAHSRAAGQAPLDIAEAVEEQFRAAIGVSKPGILVLGDNSHDAVGVDQDMADGALEDEREDGLHGFGSVQWSIPNRSVRLSLTRHCSAGAGVQGQRAAVRRCASDTNHDSYRATGSPQEGCEDDDTRGIHLLW